MFPMFTRCSCPRREKISRRKSLAAPGTRTRISGWALAFQSDALSIELSPPPNNNNNSSNNNNNKYLERLTRTGPKRLHVLYKYILSKFSAYNMNAHTRARTHRDSHTHARARTRTRTHTHTHTHQSHIRAIRAMRLKQRFLKRERFSRKI